MLTDQEKGHILEEELYRREVKTSLEIANSGGDKWQKHWSFVNSGVFIWFLFLLAGKKVLVTHGHYLDEKQTLFKDLEELIRQEDGNEAKAVRKFFTGTAQYQAVANAVSYMKGTREFVDKVHKTLSDFFSLIGKLRNKPIDSEMLEAIEMYLRYFRKKTPDVFIFGHTHNAAHTFTDDFERKPSERIIRKVIEVWNDGSFIENRRERKAGSFMTLDSALGRTDSIKLYTVDLQGNVQERKI